MDARPLKAGRLCLIGEYYDFGFSNIHLGSSNLPVNISLSSILDILMKSARDGSSRFDCRPLQRHLRRRSPTGGFPKNAKERFKD